MSQSTRQEVAGWTRSIVVDATAVLAVGVSAGIFSSPGSPTNGLLSACCLLIFGLLILTRSGIRSAMQGSAWTIVWLVQFAAWKWTHPAFFPALIGLNFGILALAVGKEHPDRSRLELFASGSLLYFALSLGFSAGPLGSFAIHLSEGLSVRLNGAGGREALLGPLHLGLPLAGWCACVALPTALRFPKQFTARLILALVLIVLSWVVRLRVESTWIVWPFIAGALLALSARRRPRHAVDLPIPAWVSSFGIVLLLGGTGWLVHAPLQDAAPGDVCFVTDGYMSLGVAEPGAYTPAGSGEPPFGLMRDVLEQAGRTTKEHSDTIYSTTLQNVRTLVMVNLDREFSANELELLKAWMNEGGRLLILGDHTDVVGLMRNFNPLLAPTGIAFNYDSTYPEREKYVWFRGIETTVHPINLASHDPGEFRGGVGASLTLAAPARPLWIAQEGWADLGDHDHDHESGLGNSGRDPWEKRGGMVTAAVSHVGEGRVAVFADTQGFHNDSMPITRRTLLHTVRWLEEGGGLASVWLPWILLVVGALLLMPFSGNAVIGFAGALCAGGIAVATLQMNAQRWEMDLPAEGPMPHAVMMLSHHPYGDPDIWSANNYDGLYLSFRRHGWLPIATREWNPDLIANAKLLVIPASFRAPTSTEAGHLDLYVKGGGTVIVTIGAEEARAWSAFLQERGFDIEAMPLGPETPVTMAEGVPMADFHEPWKWNPPTGEGARVLASIWDRAVIVERAIGEGRIIAVGDSHFLMNRMLEGLTEYNAQNVALLEYLLADLKDPSDPPDSSDEENGNENENEEGQGQEQGQGNDEEEPQ